MEIPELRLIDKTLFIDNSRLENFSVCARKGQYAIVHRRVPSDFNAALFCGEVFHLAMQFRYLYYPIDVPLPPAAIYKMQQVVERAYYANHDYQNRKPDEYRTMEYVRTLVTNYCKMYPTEDFEILSHDGRFLVERSFAVRLGEIDGITIVWIGRIDLGIKIRSGSILVLDHKTNSRGGSYAAAEYANSSQFQGYCVSLSQVLKRPVESCMVNMAVTREITRTGKGIEFQRYIIPFDHDVLEAWRENIMYLASDFLHCYKRQFFPMHTSQCITRYGQCPYLSVCTLAPMSRSGMLYSGAYKDDEFTPMHKDLIDLNAIYNEPLPENYLSIVETKPETKKGVDVNALIADLVGQTKI